MSALPVASSALTIDTFDGCLKTDRTACDLQRLTFIDAYGLVGTACALRAALDDSQTPTLARPLSPRMAEHLFATSIGLTWLITKSEQFQASNVVVPLRSTVAAGGAQSLSALLWEQLANEVDAQVLTAISEGVWELVANAQEHSGRDGLIAAQVYWPGQALRGQPLPTFVV